MTRLGAAAFVAAALVAGRLRAQAAPDEHWLARDGRSWLGYAPEARRAYVEGFLLGAALMQGADSAADRERTAETLTALRRSGGFHFPYAASVYAARLDDYYWWDNHRERPTWLALWEVNDALARRTTAGPAHQR